MRVILVLYTTSGVLAAYRDDVSSFRSDPSREAGRGCRILPAYDCWSNETSALFRRVKVESAGECCELCEADALCSRYNYRQSLRSCELFDADENAVVADYETGCAAGGLAEKRSKAEKTKNIVFIVVESTDGRTWTPGYQDDVIPMPNMRKLQASGASFRRHYSNAPVCCPSRATFWSGRQAHEIPHISQIGNFLVRGVWNNFEGLPLNYSSRIDQLLYRHGYNVLTNGKTDWSAGAHSESVQLDAWTKYVDVPYEIPPYGGWYTENPEDCGGWGSVSPGNKSVHQDDWNAVQEALWWQGNLTSDRPFFLYTGLHIVHPPYATNDFWNDQINRSKINVPFWPPLNELHPCDFQQVMRKGCAPADANASIFYDADRIKEIRAKYYAMIAEFDAMLGQYVDTLFDDSADAETLFIVTSDHGDMQEEHQQHYKMAPYDASSSVPMVIAPLRPLNHGISSLTINYPTQLIDIAPTILDVLNLPAHPRHQGQSLLPLLQGDSDSWSRDFVVQQFAGDNLAMSWSSIVLAHSEYTYKLIVWGDGRQHPHLLFNLDLDPDEMNNLIESADTLLIHTLLARLRSIIDYPRVARDVADYAHRSLEAWITLQGNDWQNAMHAKGLRYDIPFEYNLNATFDAIAAFRQENNTFALRKCRNTTTFPGAKPSSSFTSATSISSV